MITIEVVNRNVRKWQRLKFPLVVLAGVFLCQSLAATTRYVDMNSATPTPPYINWGIAATNIQDAIDAAVDGDLVLVTNGVYQTGGRVVYGALTNRVAVTKPVTVQSVNGAQETIIRGIQITNQSSSAGSVRCVYLTNQSILVGFTLTGGGTWLNATDSRDKTGAGLWCETNAVISNCVVRANIANAAGGGGYRGNYFNCSFISNSASAGGGLSSGTLISCTLIGNLAVGSAGAASVSSLSNCVVNTNRAGSNGGGIDSSTANGCSFTGNFASIGGGTANSSSLTNCALVQNAVGTSGSTYGGGASGASCTVAWS